MLNTIKIAFLMFGWILGIVFTCLIFAFLHLPEDAKLKASLKEASETSTECLSTLKTTVDATQTVIDTTNFCADMLWNLPVEELKELRKKPQPDHLPDVTPRPIVLPDAQKDAVSL